MITWIPSYLMTPPISSVVIYVNERGSQIMGLWPRHFVPSIWRPVPEGTPPEAYSEGE